MRGPTSGRPATKGHAAEFKIRVETGEMLCAKPGCEETATEVIQVVRRFVAFTEIVDAAVCKDHRDYHF